MDQDVSKAAVDRLADKMDDYFERITGRRVSKEAATMRALQAEIARLTALVDARTGECQAKAQIIAHLEAERDAIAAAAFEAAATAQLNGMDLVSRMAREAIRALTPADAKAALDRMLREAKAEGLREAAEVCDRQAETFSTDEYAVGQPLSSFSERFACAQVKTAILSRTAAQEKGGG